MLPLQSVIHVDHELKDTPCGIVDIFMGWEVHEIKNLQERQGDDYPCPTEIKVI